MVLYIFDVFIIWTIANIISKIVVIIGWVILSIWLKREFRLCTLLTKKHSKILYNAIWNYVKNETVTNMMTTSSQSILYFQTKDDWNHNAEFASMHRVYSHVHEGWNDSVELSVKFCTSNFVHQILYINFVHQIFDFLLTTKVICWLNIRLRVEIRNSNMTREI